jgi:NADH-quinone oxidoreductase subunit E
MSSAGPSPDANAPASGGAAAKPQASASASVVDPARGQPRPGGAAPGGTGSAGAGGAAAAAAVAPPAVLSEAAARGFEREIAKYPPAGKASAVIACLAILQKEHGFISRQSEQLVAQALGMPPIAVHEVTTFYNMFNQVPVGRFKFNVCTNLPCQLRGGQDALEHLCSTLGVAEGGTTADGVFTVQQAECLGACADAPVLLVNDLQMVSFMNDARLDELVATLRADAEVYAT